MMNIYYEVYNAIGAMILVVDMTDNKRIMKFLPFLLAFLEERGFPYKIARTIEDVQRVRKTNVTGVIISGSSLRLSRKIDMDLVNVAMYCHHTFDVPTLGICFGCQLLNAIHGGTVKPFGRLVCEKHNINQEKNKVPGCPGCPVQFCFNDVLDRIGVGFKVKGHATIDGKEVVCHIEKGRNIKGFLFHPELNGDKCGHLEKFLCRAAAPALCAKGLPPYNPVPRRTASFGHTP